MTDAGRDLPLAGVKVLDLSRILAGPVCTQILGDLGADVVKVERPGVGDDTRQWGPPFVEARRETASDAQTATAGQSENARGPSAYFLSCNRNKRSLALDLSTAEGRAVLEDLLRTADVMVENFLPDLSERLGLTPDRLRTLNPRLVSCSISGFGRTGPMAAVPGYDLAVQACAGLMSITGEPDGAPMKVGVAISDVVTGLYAAVSVLAGLVGRGAESSATAASGRAFDLALADCTLAALVNVAQSSLVTGKRPQRFGNAHPQIVPYEAFSTADGHIALAVGADRQWVRFCAAAERPEWADDPRFRTNPDRVAHRNELVPLVAAVLRSRTTSDWEQCLTAAEVPHARIAAVDEVLAAPQTAARAMVGQTVDRAGRSLRLLGNPIHWHDRPERDPAAPPEVGEHTDEILQQWLNYDENRLLHLRSLGVIS